MATSQNGWGVFTSAPNGDLKWITGRVRAGDVMTVFDYLCDRFDKEVEAIQVSASWGWAYRPISGQTSGFSNHASGTAIDINAPKHPLGVANTFSSTDQSTIRKILNDLGGSIRWGGDYSSRKDDMHFEVNTSAANLSKVAAKIRGGKLKSDGVNWKPKAKFPVSLSRVRRQFRIAAGLVKGNVERNNGVGRIQRALDITVDGYVGSQTLAAWTAYEERLGGDAHANIPGKKSLTALGEGRFRVVK
jgi:hypothetical protein